MNVGKKADLAGRSSVCSGGLPPLADLEISRFNLFDLQALLDLHDPIDIMYGYTSYSPPLTPPRSSRPAASTLTAQTATRSHTSTSNTARSTMATIHAGTGVGDAGNGNPTLLTYTTISQEYASLRYPGHCPLGMYLIPDKDNMFVWDGVFFVHQGSRL